ncbi:MAG: amidase [Candidatus Dormibacteria bacterium]
MDGDELLYLPMLELRDMVAQRKLSPVDLLTTYLRRIDEVNPDLNAIVEVMVEQAQAQARGSEGRVLRSEAGPLEGIPIAIKENILLKGSGMTMGSRLGLNFVSAVDSVLASRLRRAGAVFHARTAMPEFGTLARTESARWGVTRNPWNTNLTPAGSSGGAGAAVAAGMAPAAHGNDGGGSLRNPASACGLFTVKPTRARVSRAPFSDPTGLVCEGFLTRTVRDNAVLLDLVDGAVPGDPCRAGDKARPFADEVGTDPGRLKIGLSLRPPIDVPVDAACVEAATDAAALCEQLGHDVGEHSLDWGGESVLDTFLSLWAPAIGFGMDLLADGGGDLALAEPHNRALLARARALDSSRYLVVRSRAEEMARRVVKSWERYDVILTPTLATLPPVAGLLAGQSNGDDLAPLHADERFAPFASMFNITGQPAASLPLSWHEGIPVGVQAVGRHGDEATLFRLSAQLEAARPWRDRRPSL